MTAKTGMMRSLFCLIIGASLSGCATLTKGPMKRITINSNPTGAIVKLENGDVKSTPCIVRFSGFMNQTVMIEKEGYEPAAVLLTKRFLARFWWNIFFPPGMALDIISGSVWGIEPETVNLTLIKK